ncbi:MAG: DUF4446 family protein [Candidatus Saccharimonadales bacterium]
MLEPYFFAIVIATAAAALALLGLWRQAKLHRRIEKLFAGLNDDGNLEETIEQYFAEVKTTRDKLSGLQQNYQHLSQIAATSLQKTAIVRFNPFKHTGGDQSFTLALLDNHDSGFILTSIHSREGTRVYIKPIRYGSSDHTLSREEQSALDNAKSTKSPKE